MTDDIEPDDPIEGALWEAEETVVALTKERERLRCTLRDVCASIELWKAKKMHLQAVQMCTAAIDGEPVETRNKKARCLQKD